MSSFTHHFTTHTEFQNHHLYADVLHSYDLYACGTIPTHRLLYVIVVLLNIHSSFLIVPFYIHA